MGYKPKPGTLGATLPGRCLRTSYPDTVVWPLWWSTKPQQPVRIFWPYGVRATIQGWILIRCATMKERVIGEICWSRELRRRAGLRRCVCFRTSASAPNAIREGGAAAETLNSPWRSLRVPARVKVNSIRALPCSFCSHTTCSDRLILAPEAVVTTAAAHLARIGRSLTCQKSRDAEG